MASKFMMYLEGKEKGLPAKPAKAVADGGKADGKKFTDMGDKALTKLPGGLKTAAKNGGQEQVKESARRVKKPLNTEAFIDETRGLSAAEFVAYMRKTAKASGEMHEAVHSAAKAIKGSPSGVLAFVQEAKRYGFFNTLMREMLQHPEGYAALAKVLGDKNEGVDAARRLVRAVNEMVGPPAHEMGGLGGGKLGGKKPPLGLPKPGDDDDDMGDDDSDLGPDAPGLGDDDMGGLDGGLDDMGDDDGGDDDDMAALHGHGDDDDDDAEGDDDGSDDDADGPPPMGGDDSGMGGPPGPSKGFDPSKMKFPRPSMMHRLMRKEANMTPAAKNLLEALGG